ncbi:hypothetical protein HPB49_021778 [Dermacentor silvarum]|uniref:Uncharacterized protein n=1 Tax=Dermacentor silvarum TaxID=543639 RepID=A0ACB8CHE1_DERSI|nr:hypothetical protein HPB49_021778 [Dermacentor silvarum]
MPRQRRERTDSQIAAGKRRRADARRLKRAQETSEQRAERLAQDQNVEERLNSEWIDMLKTATFDAVLTFNKGSMARVNVLKAFGISPGRNTVMWLGKVNRRRLYFAKREAEDMTKQARETGKRAKKRNADSGNDYVAGGY